MKKLSKLAALAAGLIVAALVGCADISSGGTATEGYTDAKSSLTKKTLTLNVTSDSDLVKFKTADESSARTIAPDAVDADDLKFFLTGTNLVTNAAIDIQKVTFIGKDDSTTEGTVTVELEATNYRFVLIAIPATVDDQTTVATLLSKAYLVGYASADLRYTEEAASVNFVLSSDGLSGKGKLKLSLYLDEWSNHSLTIEKSAGTKVISAAKVGIYDIESGAVAAGGFGEVGTFNFLNAYTEETAKPYYGTSTNTSIQDLPAGTYDFTVTFPISDTKSYIYSEKVIILPNRTTEKVVPIPDVLELPPEAPSDFTVGYIVPEYSDSDYYKAVFNWKNNANNALYFELDLYDVSIDEQNYPAGIANVEEMWTSATYGSDTITYSNGIHNPTDAGHESVVFYGLKKNSGPNWYAGSLNRNNTQAVFYLELGKRYLARIRAVNEAGDSDYATTEVEADSYVETAVGDGTILKTVSGSTSLVDIEHFANKAHSAYSTPARTTYSVAVGGSTAQTANLTAAESDTAVQFNTEVIGLFRVTYQLVGGAFTPASLPRVYYFDQLAGGNPIVQPDEVRKVALKTGIVNSNSEIYNNNAPVALTLGTGSTAKYWTSWRTGSINGDKYESDYTECDDSTVYSAKESYYKKDANNKYGLTVLSEAPDDWSGYYTATLTPYKGYENLVLYANYTSNTFGVTIKNVADYLIENNLSITATLDGTANAAGDNPVIRTSAKSVLGEESVDVLKTAIGNTFTKTTVSQAMIDAGSNKYFKAASTATDAAFWTAAEEGDTVFTDAEAKLDTTITKEMLAAGRGNFVIGTTGTDAETKAIFDQTTTGHVSLNDIVYLKSDGTSPVTSTSRYLIVDRTQKPVTYAEVTDGATEAMVYAANNLYYLPVYKATTAEWFADDTNGGGKSGAKVYESEDGTGETAVTSEMLTASKNGYFMKAYANTNAAFWTAITSSMSISTKIYSDKKGTELAGGITLAMAKAAKNEYYQSADNNTDETFWTSTAVGATIYSDSAASVTVTVTEKMLKAARNEYYMETYVETTAAFWAAAEAGDALYSDDNGADVFGGVTQAMINAATNAYFYQDGYTHTTASFWKKATTTDNVYKADDLASPSTYTATLVTEPMINAATGKYYATKDGTDEAVNWGAQDDSGAYTTLHKTIYTKTLGADVTASNLVLDYAYNLKATNGVDASVTYEKVLVELLQQGASTATSVATYTVTGGTSLSMPLSGFANGSYILKFKAYVPSSNIKAPYEFSIYLLIND